MSAIFFLHLTGMELYRQRRKKKMVAGTSGEGPKEVKEVIALPTPPPAGMLKKTKRDGAFDLTGLSDSITVSFSSSIAAHSEFAPHVGEVEKLLFDEDNYQLEAMGDDSFGAASLEGVFMVLQKMIFAKKRIKELGEQIVRLHSEKGQLRNEVREVKSLHEQVGWDIADLKAKLFARD
ncbi:hypothetical protein OROHE_001108 [Orobanche hederae]